MSMKQLAARTAALGGMCALALVVGVSLPAYAEEPTTTRPADGRVAEQKALVEQKRAELKQQQEAKRTAVQERLAGAKLERCKKREANINRVVQNSATRAGSVQKHLQEVEQKVRDYYTKKNVTLDNFDVLSATIDDKEATAIAAIDEVKASSYNCDGDDATNPGQTVKSAVRAEHAALKAYRDAIHDLAVAIMKAQGANEKEAM